MMKKIVVLLLICATLLLVGCKEKIDYIDVTEELSCVGFQNPNDWYGTIINSEQQLQNYAKDNNQTFRSPSAGPCPILPEIDFSKYTLIGMSLSGGGCKRTGETFEISINEPEKIIYVNGRISGSGNCLAAFIGKKWALIPKISNDYRVSWNSRFSLTKEDIPELRNKLLSGEHGTVYSAMYQVELLEEDAQELVPTLLEIFNDYPGNIQERISEVLLKINPDALYPKLVKMLDGNSEEERFAIRYMIKLGKTDEVIDRVIGLINENPKNNIGFNLLHEVEDKERLSILYQLVESGNPEVEMMAAEMVLRYYPITKEHIPAIKVIFRGSRDMNKVIEKIRKLDPETREEMSDFINHYSRLYDLSPSTD